MRGPDGCEPSRQALLVACLRLLQSLLRSLGFLEKKATISIVGLDNAGKTTLQHRLKTNKIQSFIPTQRAKEETIQIGDMTISAVDLGGHQAARHLWKRYCSSADAIVFLLDSADHDRMDEARAELHELLNDEQFAAVPVAIFANKCEMKEALSQEAVSKALELDELQESHKALQLFMISVYGGRGYQDGFKWLSSQIP